VGFMHFTYICGLCGPLPQQQQYQLVGIGSWPLVVVTGLEAMLLVGSERTKIN